MSQEAKRVKIAFSSPTMETRTKETWTLVQGPNSPSYLFYDSIYDHKHKYSDVFKKKSSLVRTDVL